MAKTPQSRTPKEPSDDERWASFLNAIRKIPDRSTALQRAGLTHEALSAKLRNDEAFATDYNRAFEDGLDSMEDEVIRRAMLGVDETVFHQGIPCGIKTKYSDTLLMFYLEAHRKKFRDGDDTTRRPLSDEAKTTLRRIFADVEGSTSVVPPTKVAPPKKYTRKRGDA